MNNTAIKNRSRRLTKMACCLAALFSAGVTAAPDITAPADVTVPGAEAPSIAPVYVLDLENTVAPNGINVTDTVCGTTVANPTGLLGPVTSGSHTLSWTAVCGLTSTTVEQNVSIVPQVNFLTDQTVGEGSLTIPTVSVTVTAVLSGPAPSYPVSIPYTLSGTTTPEEEATTENLADHNAKEGSIEITSGRQGSYTFDVLHDATPDTRETIIFTIATALLPATVSPGLNTTHTVTILDINTGAEVEIIAQQSGKDTRTIVLTDGLVEIRATVNERSPLASTPKFDWSDTDAALNPPPGTDNTEAQFSFDPTSLSPGFYRVKLSYNENRFTDQELLLNVLATKPTLAVGDTDDDGLSNSAEDIYDEDNDGIVDYLDAVNDDNFLQASAIQTFDATAKLSDTMISGGMDINWQIDNAASNQVPYPDLIVTEPGLRLTLGETAFQLAIGHARIAENAIAPYVATTPSSALGSIDQHIVDIAIHDLPGVLSAYVVIPQTLPLPKSETGPLVFQHYSSNNRWEDFTTLGSDNSIRSAQRNADGYCPPPGSSNYTNGLAEGDQCIQLYIEDEGPNDHDAKTNASIHFMGAVFVPRLANCDCTLATNLSLLSENNYPDPVLDSLYSIDGYVTQITVSNAPSNTIDMVIPLATNLPLTNSGPLVLYLYTNAGTWEALQINIDSSVASAPRDSQGFCPKPSSVAYVSGVHNGDGCIQITLMDNDPNYDLDNSVGTVDIVSGVFTARQQEPDLPVLETPPLDLVASLAITPTTPVTLLDFSSTIVPTGFEISDLTSGNSTIEPSGELGPLAPGKHRLTWQIKDLGNNTISYDQIIDVIPQANFAVNQSADNGDTITVSAYLSGTAANYPVTIPFSFAANNYQININSGREGRTDVALGTGHTLGDVLNMTMASPSNALLGNKVSHSVTISDTRFAPSIQLSSSQQGKDTRNILSTGGSVIITATTYPSAMLSYDWSNSDSELIPLSGTSGSHFSFDPATLANGLYTIVLNIDDGGNSSQRDLLLRVVDSVPSELSDSTDTDDDKSSDLNEGIADTDNDGIVDYLDAISTPEWLQAWPVGVYKTALTDSKEFTSDNFKINWSITSLASNQVAYSLLITTDPGLQLSLGPTAFTSDSNHARVLVQDAVDIIGSAYSPTITSADGYVVDVEISQLPSPGQTVTLYIPQTAPLPPGPAGITAPLPEGQLGFFIYAQNAWSPLDTLGSDSLASQVKTDDYCPITDTININSPTDNYDTGLSTNHECLRLTLTDGGPNDSDGRVNGSIRLLGGVFINTNKADPAEPEPYPDDFDITPQSQTEQRNDSGGGGGAFGWLVLFIATLRLVWRQKSR